MGIVLEGADVAARADRAVKAALVDRERSARVVEAAPGAPWSMAGLPASSARVWVAPPLLASGPSSGSWPVMSPL